MTAALWLSIALPTLAAAIARVGPRATAAAGGFVAAIPPWILVVGAASGERSRSNIEWIPGLDAGLRLDALSAAMTATVATVGAVIVLYATGYFAADRRGRSALAWLLGFLAAMQGLVLADGYLTLLVFWELVGAASARLIAYSREDPAAAPGAVRAFLTTRSADLGFYLAVLALFSAHGTLAFGGERPAGALGAVVGIGLVAAAMGKSAQVPLQTWLSAAMAGPTPVSALLHSATMVAAGVYLLARSHDLLAGWPLDVAGWVGAVTAVAGAAIALAQTDLKRVLAGSTTSQLGLMFVGVAAGGPAVALFHLIAHAAGKAGMFLAAGVFQRGRGSTGLSELRGAGRDDRAAFAGFAIGALSIAAVPPFAAFWSKDHIAAASQPHAAWFVLVLLSTAGSAAYLLRPALVLWDRRGAGGRRARSGRVAMLAGVAAAAAGSTLLGLIGEPLTRLLDAPTLPTSSLAFVLSPLAVAAGVAAVAAHVAVPDGLAVAARRQLFGNESLRAAIERPVRLAASALDVLERRVVDAAVDGVGRAVVALTRAQDRLERRRIDAAVDGLAHAVARGGDDLRRLQSGRLYEYLRDAVVGAVALALVVALAALT